ncbi:MAG: FAD-dependent oxidoreductase, partial [Gammaproteobacteria bacterium]|nr:FAD-dependent oxidoreductase [Gammaproteobacteria bacterium]
FAGLVAASRLARRFDVTVVDPRADFEWTPNIHELISGVKSRDSVVLPRTACVNRYGHAFINDAVTRIDQNASTVATAGGLLLPYDACLIAAGSQRTMFGVPGAQEHTVGLRQVDDAVRIGAQLDRLAKRKRQASVVIVGGGVSGIEAVGEIIRRRVCADHPQRFDVHVVEQTARILPQQPQAVARDAVRRCASFDVTLHTDTSVTAVNPRSVTLENGTKLPADLCIWSAGMTLPEFLQDADLHDEEHQWLPVDETLRSFYAENIFVAGDCAELPNPVRKQAYYAMDMGKIAGDNIARLLDDRPLLHFRPAPMPMLIAFGDLTTWLVAGDYAAASPLLAAAKEGVYQATMARFASPHQPLDYVSGVAGRAALATQQLLLPQLRPTAILRNVTGGRILA